MAGKYEKRTGVSGRVPGLYQGQSKTIKVGRRQSALNAGAAGTTAQIGADLGSHREGQEAFRASAS